jgi:hypothetical protein
MGEDRRIALRQKAENLTTLQPILREPVNLD